MSLLVRENVEQALDMASMAMTETRFAVIDSTALFVLSAAARAWLASQEVGS